MANRRMFSSEIAESDDFAELSNEAQLLYFHLVMSADNRGYVNKTRKIISCLNGIEKSHLNELVQKKFILKRNETLYLIKGWYVHNEMPKYAVEETNYLDDLNKLYFDENYSYTEKKTEKSVVETLKNSMKKKLFKENKVKESKIKESKVKENNINNISNFQTNNDNIPTESNDENNNGTGDDDLF